MISKSGQSAEALRSCAAEFDTDRLDRMAFAVRLDFSQYEAEVPFHRHRQGQLVMALHGAVTCRTQNALWIVPPDCGVWIPGGILHSNQATSNAQLSYLFVEPGAAALPIEALSLPASHHPKINAITAALTEDPSDRRTLADWAAHVAMSERSLKRLMVDETGLTFGRWRRQLHLVIALRELASGVSVQRVSSDLGYDSPTAFIVMFKKALGTTPTRYFSRQAADRSPRSIRKRYGI